MRLHQSSIKHYFRCPKAFKLSAVDKIQPNIGTKLQSSMDLGCLFEGYIFGFKADKDEKELIGRKQSQTILPVKKDAAIAKPIFDQGEPYVKLRYKGDGIELGGEADYIGTLNAQYLCSVTEQPDVAMMIKSATKYIVDLKYTGSIKRVWDYKDSAEDYIQAVQYCYIVWKNTGELLPFIYIIVENTKVKPIIHVRKIAVSEMSFDEWYLPKINEIQADIDMGQFTPQPNEHTCCGSRGDAGCWFLAHCKEGREYVGRAKLIEFDNLFKSE